MCICDVVRLLLGTAEMGSETAAGRGVARGGGLAVAGWLGGRLSDGGGGARAGDLGTLEQQYKLVCGWAGCGLHKRYLL